MADPIVFPGFGMTVAHGIMLVVHNEHDPPQHQWEQFFAFTRENMPKNTLVSTLGAKPNALQRKLMRDLLEKHTPKPLVAVLTDSVLVRTALTAMNVFVGKQTCPFAPSAIDDALAFVGVHKDEFVAVKESLRQLKQAAGIRL